MVTYVITLHEGFVIGVCEHGYFGVGEAIAHGATCFIIDQHFMLGASDEAWGLEGFQREVFEF